MRAKRRKTNKIDAGGPDPADRAPARDEGLACPKCDYNLTGLPTERCPECGATFDRDKLIQEYANRPGPIPIWDERGTRGTPQALATILWVAWWHPTRLTVAFHPRIRERSGWALQAWCLFLAVVPVLVVTAAARNFEQMLAALLSTTLGVPALFIGEGLLYGFSYGDFVGPRSATPRHHESWAVGHMHLVACYAPLAGLATAAFVLLSLSSTRGTPRAGLALLGLALVFWWVQVARIVTARDATARGRPVALPAALMFVLFAASIGVASSFAVALLIAGCLVW